jgi:amino acid adenylation domain-containing protein
MMNKKIIHTVVEHIAATYPDKIAIRKDNCTISYRDLNNGANQLTRLLKDLGVVKGSIVGVLASPGIPLVQTVLSVFKNGSIYLPVDTSQAEERIVQIFSDCAPKVIVVDAENEADVKSLISKHGFAVEYVVVWNNGKSAVYINEGRKFKNENRNIAFYAGSNTELVSEPDDSNYIFYTSGSTGVAKAILGCNKGLGHFINWEIEEFKLDKNCAVSFLSQFTFDASLRDIFIPLCTGGTLCIPSPDVKGNIIQLLEWIEENKITLIHCVPSIFRLVVKELESFDGRNIAQHLKFILMAGEPLYVKDIKNWRERMGDTTELVNLYGTSETTLAKTFHRIKDIPADPAQTIHAGKPISNTVVAILNGDIPCGPGEIGEIYIKTPFMSKGYYNNEELTKKIFVQNPLVTDRVDLMHKTGDFGRYAADGTIEVLGRRDEQVKVNGIRVELGEIRQKVAAIKDIEEVEIVAIKNNDMGNDLVCYYTGRKYDANAIKEMLETTLNRNVTPAWFIHLDKFPLTINGKVDKRALPAPVDFLVNDHDYKAPVSDMERSLEEMCKQVLGLNRVDRNISFFRIGGTSLKAMQYISAIYKEFGISINLRDIFERDSIAELALFISNTPVDAGYNEIPNVPSSAYYELSHAQKRLWVTDQFKEEKLKYNMPFVSHITGRLQIPVLEKVVDTIINRHEMLRTTFVVVDGIPKQLVHPAETSYSRINHIDISKYDNKTELASEIIGEELSFTFDLQYGPLLRITLIQLAEEEYNFVLTMHHIISDGWSVELLVRELFTLYQSFSNNEKNPLKPLRIHYKDFASWQNNQLKGELLQGLEKYWLHQFRDDPPALVFPADFSNTNQVFLNGAIMEFEIDETLTGQLNELAQRNESSLFMVLMTMVKVLLTRYTGQQDIIVGTPAATRKHPELESQIGLYINVLPIRTRLKAEEDTFKMLLSKVKQNLLGALEHDLYPYDLLIERLGLARQASRFPLINVLVQSQYILGETVPAIPGLTITDCSLDNLTSKVDITFNFKQTIQGIKAAIEYDACLFKRSTISQVIDNLQHIGRAIAADDSLVINDIKLLKTEEEKSEEEKFKQLMMAVK